MKLIMSEKRKIKERHNYTIKFKDQIEVITKLYI